MSRNVVVSITVAGLLVAIGVFVWLSQRRPPGAERPEDDSLPPGIDAAAAAEALQRLNVGVAHAENDQLKSAIEDFRSLADTLPDEVAPVRDLIIAQILGIAGGAASGDDVPITSDAAATTFDRLRELQPDALATRVLGARLAATQKNVPLALQRLQAATQFAPDDLPTWFEQYALSQYESDPELQQQSRAALDRAFEIAPTNLVVLLEQLQAQVKEEDPTIIQTFEAGQPRWDQLAPGIRDRIRVEMTDLVDAAKQAVEDGNWPIVRRNVLLIRNVVTPEEATRSDRRLVERHALEFILDEFSDPVMQLARQSTDGEESSPIEFATVNDDWTLPVDEAVVAVVAADFDLDTQPDIACLSAESLAVYRRADDEWTLMANRDLSESFTGFVAVDLDADADNAEQVQNDRTGHPNCHRADLDFVVFGAAGVAAFQNVKTETARELEPIELPEPLATLREVTRIVPVDLDMDGDLDLLSLSGAGVGMWSNRGNLSFTADDLNAVGLPDGETFRSVVAVDWDEDVDIDIVLCDASGKLGMLENLRHGEFQWRDLGVDVQVSVSAIEPIDDDGQWGLLIGGPEGLKRLAGARSAEGESPGTTDLIDGAGFGDIRLQDLNNDGWMDVVSHASGVIVTMAGNGDGTFRSPQTIVEGNDPDAADPAAGDEGVPRMGQLSITDVNHDGLLDLVTVSATIPRVFLNQTTTDAGWIDVSLLAEQIKGGDLSSSGRVNHYGIGSVVEVRSGAHRQRQIVRTPSVHFGLGSATEADTVRVLWTNGVPENVIQPAARTFICERQTLKGSCPFLYGWDGERFTFITDLLWASPIGLVDPNGQLVPARPWEYLKINGSQLRPRDGRYEMRVTEELWEAAYFDSVRLFAIDHPEGTEIFTNDKVGPPSIAEHRIHTVRQRQVPVSAVDQTGRDVLPLIRDRDEQYVKPFDRKLRQGFTEPTTLEIDLGQLEQPQKVMLYLTGWIYPTDTTINIALSQNPDLDGPLPLSLAVPDSNGEWETVLPFSGFPGGKTKTIAIDLSNRFLTDDYRIRLSTSMELYWDAIFFTVDEEPVEIRETELTLVGAELGTRGVSAALVHPQFGPERYDYDNVTPSPWVPMDGHFTRFGDVRELLSEDDSRLLVMGSGDEARLSFAAIDPPPDGWTRDFVIRNVGWDKDADLHTVYGQTVEPLPLIDMSAYPWPLDEFPPDTPSYREYLRTMQTRVMSH